MKRLLVRILMPRVVLFFALGFSFLVMGALAHAKPLSAAAETCAFKDCGKGGPFQTLEEACPFLKGRYAGEGGEPGISKGVCRTVRKVTLGTPAPIEEAATFSVTYDIAAPSETQFLALRSQEGWRVMGELQTVVNTGLGGAFEDGVVDNMGFQQLIPGGPEEFLMNYRHSHQESGDPAKSRETVLKRTMVCGWDGKAAFCTAPIPKAVLSTETAEGGKAKTLPGSYEIAVRFQPEKGAVTLTPEKGKVPAAMQPLLGTHSVLDLPRWGQQEP